MKPAASLALALATSGFAAETPADMPPADLFRVHCSACHVVDRMQVGPSLVEIAGIYRDAPEDFVKWCVEPRRKREGVVEMPSMAHLGEPALRKLHGYILEAAEGKTELEKGGGDPFAVPRAMVRRPRVQRIFLPGASPAAIAVALPGELSYCFDAAECRLRYVWRGGFIDGGPYWRTNGSSRARIDGDIVYREPGFPLRIDGGESPGEPEFLGYRVNEDGLPTFRYRRGGILWTETIRPLDDGSGIRRRFETDSAKALSIRAPEGVRVESSTGDLELDAGEAASFTLTHRWQ